MLNVDADGYLLNDIDSCVISLHRMLQGYIGREGEFMDELYAIIDQYGLSLSLRSDVVPRDLKAAYPKTYYARYNKTGYQHMKADFIADGQHDMKRLYLLLIYGFTKEDRIAAWEREQVRKVIRWFRKTRICREINRMLRAYEMAHQEVRR